MSDILATRLLSGVDRVRGDAAHLDGGINRLRGDLAKLRAETQAAQRGTGRGGSTASHGDITDIRGSLTALRGDVTNFRGAVNSLRGDAKVAPAIDRVASPSGAYSAKPAVPPRGADPFLIQQQAIAAAEAGRLVLAAAETEVNGLSGEISGLQPPSRR